MKNICFKSLFAFFVKKEGAFSIQDLSKNKNTHPEEIDGFNFFDMEHSKLSIGYDFSLYPLDYLVDDTLNLDIKNQTYFLPDIIELKAAKLYKENKKQYFNLNIKEDPFQEKYNEIFDIDVVCMPICLIGKEKHLNDFFDHNQGWITPSKSFIDTCQKHFNFEGVECLGFLNSDDITENMLQTSLLARESKSLSIDQFRIKKFDFSKENKFNSFILLNKEVNVISFLTLDDFLIFNKNKISKSSIEYWFYYQLSIRETFSNAAFNQLNMVSINAKHFKDTNTISDIEIIDNLPEFNEFDYFKHKHVIKKNAHIDKLVLYTIKAFSHESGSEEEDIDMLILSAYNQNEELVHYENIYFISQLGLDNAQNYIVEQAALLNLSLEINPFNGVPYSAMQNKVVSPDVYLNESNNLIIH